MPDDAVDTRPLPPLMPLGKSLWAITREVLPRLREASLATTRDWEGLAARFGASAPKAARRSAANRAGGSVAVLPLTGVLTPRGSFLSMLFGGGGGGLQDFRETFREAVNSPDVGAIVLDVDSPGGLIDLVPETAAEIRDARGAKPIVAVANTLAASGAYWIAAQADELIVTPSGDVGSIGVYMLHEDWSGWNEQQGIEPTYISAGRYKIEGNPDNPLDEEAQAAWQQEVDDLHVMFVDAVAEGRGVSGEVVRDEYGEGRTLMAARALAAGMVDRVETLETVIGELLVPGTTGSAAARAGRLAKTERRAESPAPTDPPEDPPAPADPPAPVPADPPADPPEDPPAPSDPPGDDGPDAEARAAIAALLV